MNQEHQNSAKLDKIASTIERCQQRLDQHRIKRQQYLLAHFGPTTQRLIDSLQETIQLLECGDVQCRTQALAVLKECWGKTGIARVRESLLWSLTTLEQPQTIQSLAIYCLRQFHSCTASQIALASLASIVLDSQRTALVRGIAYEGLLEVRGDDVLQWPSFVNDDWVFPDNVDWVFVQSCLNTSA
jgi:hypothetical protein